MTEKEKAKAYDKALKVIKECNPDENGFITIYPQEIFSELKESESDDEVIRKRLINICQDAILYETLADYTTKNFEECLAWLKKQDNKPVDNVEPKFKVGDTMRTLQEANDGYTDGMPVVVSIDNEYYHCTNELIAIKDQDEYELPPINVKQKHNDKPKFKVGDWIVNKQDKIARINQIKEDSYGTQRYYIEFTDGAKTDPMPCFADEDFRLWTIQDAKDGDVLFQDLMCGKTFIYNGVNTDMAILYSFIISNDGDVLPYHIGKPNTGIGNIEENKNIIYPATKEQRDLLFQKMREAGYEYDVEKKVLRKFKLTTMKREEQIQQAAEKFVWGYHPAIERMCRESFISGCKWSDENPNINNC